MARKRNAPLLVVTAPLGDPAARKLVRQMLAIADKHLKAKRDELAIETIRAIRNALEGHPVAISNCMFRTGK